MARLTHLQALREAAGVSRAELAAASHTSEALLARLEAGTARAHRPTVFRLAEALGVPMSALGDSAPESARAPDAPAEAPARESSGAAIPGR